MAQVMDVMIYRVDALAPDDKLTMAAEKMKTCDVDVLPVVEGESLVGVVSEEDMIGAAEKRGLAAGTAPVSEAMRAEVAYLYGDEDVAKALERMEHDSMFATKDVLVVDKDKRPIGIVSRVALRKHLEQGDPGMGDTAISGVGSIDDLVSYRDDAVEYDSDTSFPASDPPPPPNDSDDDA